MRVYVYECLLYFVDRCKLSAVPYLSAFSLNRFSISNKLSICFFKLFIWDSFLAILSKISARCFKFAFINFTQSSCCRLNRDDCSQILFIRELKLFCCCPSIVPTISFYTMHSFFHAFSFLALTAFLSYLWIHVWHFLFELIPSHSFRYFCVFTCNQICLSFEIIFSSKVTYALSTICLRSDIVHCDFIYVYTCAWFLFISNVNCTFWFDSILWTLQTVLLHFNCFKCIHATYADVNCFTSIVFHLLYTEITQDSFDCTLIQL